MHRIYLACFVFGRVKKLRLGLFVFVSGCCLTIFFEGCDIIFNILDNCVRENSTRSFSYNEKLQTVGDGKFYIFSAIAEFSPQSTRSWSSIVINGWETRGAYKHKYKCCYMYADMSYKSTLSGQKRSWLHNEPLMARQVLCNISNINRPEFVSLVLPDESCHNRTYQAPLYRIPFTEPKFAICAKIAYGQKNPVELIEWLEYHLRFGPNRIVIYPYEDLNKKAWDVLRYYANTSVLEIVPLPYVPKLDKFNRQFSYKRVKGTYQKIMWQDEQVVDFDAQERLKQYKYYTIMDTDEFIAQKGKEQRTFIQLMEFLLSRQNTTASFTMFSEMHLLEWPKTNNNSKLKFGQYGSHTRPMLRESKLLHVSERLEPGSVWIHTSKPAAGYEKNIADPSIVVLKHLRTCKSNWAKLRKKPCHVQFEMFYDTLLETTAERIAQKVLNVKSLLNLK